MSGERNVTQQVGLLKSLVNRGRLVFRLMADARVPIYLKAMPVVAALYVVSPLDFIPDLAIGLGQLDDLGVILAGVEGFIALCPPYVVDEHLKAIEQNAPFSASSATSSASKGGETIDGEWRVRQ
jgi:uncharacterized membrane protein YkvA (DUF1232 family)